MKKLMILVTSISFITNSTISVIAYDNSFSLLKSFLSFKIIFSNNNKKEI